MQQRSSLLILLLLTSFLSPSRCFLRIVGGRTALSNRQNEIYEKAQKALAKFQEAFKMLNLNKPEDVKQAITLVNGKLDPTNMNGQKGIKNELDKILTRVENQRQARQILQNLENSLRAFKKLSNNAKKAFEGHKSTLENLPNKVNNLDKEALEKLLATANPTAPNNAPERSIEALKNAALAKLALWKSTQENQGQKLPTIESINKLADTAGNAARTQKINLEKNENIKQQLRKLNEKANAISGLTKNLKEDSTYDNNPNNAQEVARRQNAEAMNALVELENLYNKDSQAQFKDDVKDYVKDYAQKKDGAWTMKSFTKFEETYKSLEASLNKRNEFNLEITTLIGKFQNHSATPEDIDTWKKTDKNSLTSRINNCKELYQRHKKSLIETLSDEQATISLNACYLSLEEVDKCKNAIDDIKRLSRNNTTTHSLGAHEKAFNKAFEKIDDARKKQKSEGKTIGAKLKEDFDTAVKAFETDLKKANEVNQDIIEPLTKINNQIKDNGTYTKTGSNATEAKNLGHSAALTVLKTHIQLKRPEATPIPVIKTLELQGQANNKVKGIQHENTQNAKKEAIKEAANAAIYAINYLSAKNLHTSFIEKLIAKGKEQAPVKLDSSKMEEFYSTIEQLKSSDYKAKAEDLDNDLKAAQKLRGQIDSISNTNVEKTIETIEAALENKNKDLKEQTKDKFQALWGSKRKGLKVLEHITTAGTLIDLLEKEKWLKGVEDILKAAENERTYTPGSPKSYLQSLTKEWGIINQYHEEVTQQYSKLIKYLDGYNPKTTNNNDVLLQAKRYLRIYDAAWNRKDNLTKRVKAKKVRPNTNRQGTVSTQASISTEDITETLKCICKKGDPCKIRCNQQCNQATKLYYALNKALETEKEKKVNNMSVQQNLQTAIQGILDAQNENEVRNTYQERYQTNKKTFDEKYQMYGYLGRFLLSSFFEKNNVKDLTSIDKSYQDDLLQLSMIVDSKKNTSDKATHTCTYHGIMRLVWELERLKYLTKYLEKSVKGGNKNRISQRSYNDLGKIIKALKDKANPPRRN